MTTKAMSSPPDYSRNNPRGWMGDPKRGAALGRHMIKGTPEFEGTLYVMGIEIDNDGYDRLGTYWGIDGPLWWVADEDYTIDRTYHGPANIHAASAVVMADYPLAKVKVWI